MADVRPFPKPVDAPPSERAAGVIEALQYMLEAARAGEITSVCIAALNADGTGVRTTWNVEGKDATLLVGHLAAIQHDLLAGRC